MTSAQKAKDQQYPSDIAPLILLQSSLHIMQLHFLNLAQLFCLLPLTVPSSKLLEVIQDVQTSE